MCGVLPLKATMEGAKLNLGYRKILFPTFTLKGHEFHYSTTSSEHEVNIIARQLNARDMEVSTPLYRYKNVIAGYTHLYWAENDIYRLW